MRKRLKVSNESRTVEHPLLSLHVPEIFDHHAGNHSHRGLSRIPAAHQPFEGLRGFRRVAATDLVLDNLKKGCAKLLLSHG